MRLHNRQIKATFWNDQDLLQWPRDKRMFYAGLVQLADDSGCLEDSPFTFKIMLYPSPLDGDITIEILSQWIEEFVQQGKLSAYQVGGKPYLFMNNFHKHQTLEKPAPPTKASVPVPLWVEWKEAINEDGKKSRRGSRYEVDYNSIPGLYPDTVRTSPGPAPVEPEPEPEPEPELGTGTNNSFGGLFDSCDSVTAPEESQIDAQGSEDDSKKPKKRQTERKFSEDAKDVAKYLQDQLQTHGVDHFPRDWLLNNYSTANRLLKDIPKADLMACIDWAMAEQFWRVKTNDMLSIERAYMQFRRRSSDDQNGEGGSAFGVEAEVV